MILAIVVKSSYFCIDIVANRKFVALYVIVVMIGANAA